MNFTKIDWNCVAYTVFENKVLVETLKNFNLFNQYLNETKIFSYLQF